ncbi:MAG: transketolase [Afipia felis]|nr:transketolase [Afipia felis]
MTADAKMSGDIITLTRRGKDAKAKLTHHEMANAIRFLAIDAVEKANSGHPGMPMGMADVATVLFSKFLKFDPLAPGWLNRDRFVLSAGHGSMLLYALLHLTGYREMTLDEIKSFRQWGSKTPGHPEYGHTAGVETTTGPLGQGIATAVGMALAERMSNARLGDDLVDHYTYVMCGDGCLMEGVSQEAISLAGHLKLGRLIVLFDDNSISIDGPTSLSCSDDPLARAAASGWSVRRVDGHDPTAVEEAIAEERETDRPSLIACRTRIGYGSPGREGSEKAHGAPLGADEIAATRAALAWPHAPFEIPRDVLAAWRTVGARGQTEHDKWVERLAQLDREEREHVNEVLNGKLSRQYDPAIRELCSRFATEQPKIATRQASQQVIEMLASVLPNLAGGSADLTHSNLTLAKSQKPIKPGHFEGNYIHYGIREHGMAAAMNGIALHGGFIPYGGTFLTFADYSRPAIRMAALMSLRVIHVMTHDSIGLGEDGPTHQPVEHLASLRAIPNLLVFRPADAVETAEAWDCALRAEDRPSILCLSRQALPTFRSDTDGVNKVARGAYLVINPQDRRDVTLIATGSEVAIAMEAARLLEKAGVRAAVVSAPCLELFAHQPEDYRRAVLGERPRVGIEAAIEGGWARLIGDHGEFVGMTGFGASAPANVLYREFGITPEAVVLAAKRSIDRSSSKGA